ncbi:MAG TPA: hypothetical protein VNA15_10875 [Candidatus Angelobacter sp.]|nr:hypothetical protein [Candidatus Angelobacter sp.]
MGRTVLELRCIKCGTEFEKSFEQKRGNSDFSEGKMVRLEGSSCPNKCSGEWFAVEKSHPIRKFKRTF